MKLHTGRALALAFVAGTLALATPDPGAAQQRRGGGMFGGGEAMMLWGRLDQGFDEFAGTLSLTEAQKQLVTIVADDISRGQRGRPGPSDRHAGGVARHVRRG